MQSVRSSAHFDGFAEPSRTLSICVVTLLFGSLFCRVVHANSVLHIIFPLANVLVAIWEEHGPLTFLFAGLEISFVHAAVFES